MLFSLSCGVVSYRAFLLYVRVCLCVCVCLFVLPLRRGVACLRYEDEWPTPLDRGLLHTPPEALPPVVLELQRHASVHFLQEQRRQQQQAAASVESESKTAASADVSSLSSSQGRAAMATATAMLGTASSGRSPSQVRGFCFEGFFPPGGKKGSSGARLHRTYHKPPCLSGARKFHVFFVFCFFGVVMRCDAYFLLCLAVPAVPGFGGAVLVAPCR